MPRLVISLIALIVCLAVTDVLALINTDSWQLGFFHLTLVTVVIINIMVAIFQVTLTMQKSH
jgi:hypothetical protein